MGGEPGQQGGVFNAGLAPDVDDGELAGAQKPGKGLRADPQPPLRFVEGDQLRRGRELQGEVRLPRGRAASWRGGVWTGRHGRGFTSQSRTCDAVDGDGRQTRTVWADPGRQRRESMLIFLS